MTDLIGFGEALKAFRRGVHVHGRDWRGLVLSENVEHLNHVRAEAARIFDGSSLLSTFSTTQRAFTFEPSGATLKLRPAQDTIDAYMLAGSMYAHIIWVFRPSYDVREYVQTLLRSPSIEQDKLRMDYSGL
jgi:hypothetical protein